MPFRILTEDRREDSCRKNYKRHSSKQIEEAFNRRRRSKLPCRLSSRAAGVDEGQGLSHRSEAAAIEKRTADNRAATDKAGPLESGSYNRFWYNDGTKVLATRQTSLVVDPPDGRVPVKPSAEARRDDYDARNADSYEFMSPWDRCITRGVPGSMFPAGYNNAYQIIQTPGYVAIHYEMIHDARIIPLDNRPPIRRACRSWMGEPRGHWDGDTSVPLHGLCWPQCSASSARRSDRFAVSQVMATCVCRNRDLRPSACDADESRGGGALRGWMGLS